MSLHIEDLVREAALRAAKVASTQQSGQTVSTQSPAAVVTPFNAHPAALKIGDRVKRGPSWSVSGHQNEDRRGEGSVISVAKAPGVLIQWDENSSNQHIVTYDPASSTMDVELVDPATGWFYLKRFGPTRCGLIWFDVTRIDPPNDSFNKCTSALLFCFLLLL